MDKEWIYNILKKTTKTVPITEKGKFYFFSPILNFSSSLQKIMLEKDFIICKANKREKKLIAQDKALGDFWHEWSYVTRAEVPLEDDSKLERFGLLQQAPYRFCTALRLIKSGTVGLGPIYMVWLPTFKFIAKLGSNKEVILSDTYGEYNLAQDEVILLKDIYKQLMTQYDKAKQHMNTAIFRFNISYENRSLIDLMIGLEALYLADDKELGYKLAMRASSLLGDTDEDTYKLFSTLIAAYALRGKLVHGKNTGSNDKVKLKTGELVTESELNNRVREILRKSILAFMKLQESISHKRLIDKLLDENILNKGKSLNVLLKSS